nr:PREDICTED: uncharacterized protein LOC105675320 [Linepithema humile]XP_012227773.1 PREDICTED: uncharacterized protein LOC105675320 [Linepithema humile]
MPPNIGFKKHMWKYYTKLPNFKAQCMFCEKKYTYISSYTNFYQHVARHHITIWKYEEKRKVMKEPWMYFKYLNKLYSQCIICDANVLSTFKSVKNHLNLHSGEQRKNYAYQNWSRKYWTQESDFVVECNVCHDNVSFPLHSIMGCHIKKTHLDKFKNTQEIHDTVGTSELVPSFQTDSLSLSITTKNLWKYYIKLPDFKAQCMFCEKKYNYINTTKFYQHVARHHITIWQHEEERKQMKEPWMYFKYLNKLYLQCMICDANVLSTFNSVKNHLNLHSGEQRKNYAYRCWPRKYWTQESDFVVKCNICHNNVSFLVNNTVDHHIRKTHLDKLKNMQETHDTVDSSERVSSFQTNSMSLNIATKKHVWKYYIKLSDFKAQCMFCEKEYSYVTYRNFNKHVTIHHRTIWKYEERKLMKKPWMYFKYLNELYSQCIICDANVLSTFESVKRHLNLHSGQQRKNYAYRCWPRKYWTQESDFVVNCNICHDNVSLSVHSYIDHHIRKTHLDKLKNMQETHDTVDSSERV